MQRTRTRGPAVVGYAVLAYATFLAASVWAVTFLADLQLPRGIDHGAHQPVGLAVVVDLALLLLFAVQHSVMARAGFKRWVARWIPAPAERSTYVLAASLVLLLLYWQWQPMTAPIWDLHGVVAAATWVVFALGWLIAVGSTFMVDHLDVFGLRQAYRHARGCAPRPAAFPRALAVPLGSPSVDAWPAGGLLGDPAHDGLVTCSSRRPPPATSWSACGSRSTTSSTSWAISTATTPTGFPPSSRCADQPGPISATQPCPTRH